jgi:hypothetical protein
MEISSPQFSKGICFQLLRLYEGRKFVRDQLLGGDHLFLKDLKRDISNTEILVLGNTPLDSLTFAPWNEEHGIYVYCHFVMELRISPASPSTITLPILYCSGSLDVGIKNVLVPADASYAQFINAFIDQVITGLPAMWDMVNIEIARQKDFDHETFSVYLVPRSALADDKARLALTFLCSHKVTKSNTCVFMLA